MKQINESGGDIFDKQPFPVLTNMHSVSDPKEKVLGYFQVSSVSRKRIYITKTDVRNLDIKLYRYPCELIFASPADFPKFRTPDDIQHGVQLLYKPESYFYRSAER